MAKRRDEMPAEAGPTSSLTDEQIRERQIDEQVDKDRDGIYRGKIARRRPDESILGYERRVSLEMTMILYPYLRAEFGGREVMQFDRHRERQMPNYWQSLFNAAMFPMVSQRRGVTPESLREALALRDRYAGQCREMWGDKKPEPNDEFDGVMRNMLARIEAALVALPVVRAGST